MRKRSKNLVEMSLPDRCLAHVAPAQLLADLRTALAQHRLREGFRQLIPRASMSPGGAAGTYR